MGEHSWSKQYDCLVDSPVFANPRLLKLWVWCKARAGRNARTVPVRVGEGSTEVALQPGQFAFSKRTAARELRFSPSTIERMIEKLQALGLLDRQPGQHYSVITVRPEGIWAWSDQQNGPPPVHHRSTTQKSGPPIGPPIGPPPEGSNPLPGTGLDEKAPAERSTNRATNRAAPRRLDVKSVGTEHSSTAEQYAPAREAIPANLQQEAFGLFGHLGDLVEWCDLYGEEWVKRALAQTRARMAQEELGDPAAYTAAMLRNWTRTGGPTDRQSRVEERELRGTYEGPHGGHWD